MSLHVNIGPRWTYGSHCSIGCRGYLTGSSIRPLSLLTSSSRVNSHRLRGTLFVPRVFGSRSYECTWPRSRLYPPTGTQSLPILNRRASFFTTSSRDCNPSQTDVDVQDSNNKRPVLFETPESSPPTAPHDATLQTALNRGEQEEERSSWNRFCDVSSRLKTQKVSSSKRGCQGNAEVIEECPANGDSEEYRAAELGTRSRQLPSQFEHELTRLGRLLSEKKGMKEIRDAFGIAVQVRDSLWQTHGCEIDRWLAGPWDSIKAKRVMQLLLGSIVTSPHQILNVLQNMGEIYNDFSRRCQCLSYTGYMYKDILTMNQGLMAKFDSEVRKLASPHLWPTGEMRRRHLSMLLWRTNEREVQSLIEHFLQKYPLLSVNTRTYLAMYSSLKGLDTLALSILTNLPSEELQSPGDFTLRCCQVLLRHDVVESTPEGPNFKFLPRLLEKGLTPDNVLYSRIMERALDSGYPGVAWDVFRHLQAKDIEITGWTYLILLRHAFNAGNLTGVQELMSEIQQKEALYRNVHLLTYSMNIVRRIFNQEKEMTLAESLSHLLALYDRVYSRDALVKLDIVPSIGSSKSSATGGSEGAANELVEPDAYSLSFTIWTFVLCNRSSRSVRALWARIQGMVEAGDTKMVECMRLDLIYNAFIWLHLKSGQAQSMAAALGILQYMLSKQLCLPTDRTWSILICGFLRYDQKDQAKKIYELMKQSDFTMQEIRKEYWRRNWTFEYFEKHLEEILDEESMPDGTKLGEFLSDELSEKEVIEETASDVERSMWTWAVEEGGHELETGNRNSSDTVAFRTLSSEPLSETKV